VNQLIHASSEDKYAVDFNEAVGASAPQQFTSTIKQVSDFKMVMPPIAQGIDGYSRIGNKITPKALVLKMTLTCTGAPTTNSSEQVWGRLFIGTHKSYKYRPTFVSNVVPSTLLLNAGGSTFAYSGDVNSNNWRVNRKEFNINKDKLIKFQRGFGTLPQAANVVPYIGDQVYTSPFATHQLTIRIPCPKTLVYATNTDQYPSNFAPFFAFGYCAPQGPITGDNGEMDYRVGISWVSHFDFEDE
jgi:hypothetical protein